MDIDRDQDSEFYLNLVLRKSQGETDEHGNVFFVVEASNENLDLQKQIVLQRALLESKDDFLTSGVISYDHLHKRRGPDGQPVSDPSMIIGEPTEVMAEGKKTIVRGKLYATNEKAQEIIKLLKAGSTRIKASVGGLFPKIVKDAKTGIEKITSVFWNDLAITVSPVNASVTPAYLAKSMDPDEFVKALMAASPTTDHAEFAGGRALILENVGEKAGKTVNVTKAGIKKLIRLMDEGKIETEKDAVGFLVEQGFEEGKARTAVREIIFQGGQTTMAKGKGKFASAVSSILKSLTGDKEEGKKEDEPENINEEGLKIEGIEEDPDEEGGEVKKSGKVINANELLVGLQEDLGEIRKSLEDNDTRYDEIQKSIDDLGEAIVQIGTAITQIANSPLPPQSVLGKSLGGPAGMRKGGAAAPKDRPTMEDLNRVQIALNKAFKEGRIDLHKSTQIESDMQKAIRNPNFTLQAEDYEFLMKELGATA
jgi:hypothetical protein